MPAWIAMEGKFYSYNSLSKAVALAMDFTKMMAFIFTYKMYLVKLQGIQQISELLILFIFSYVQVILKKSVKHKFCLVVYENFVLILHESSTGLPDFLRHCSAEHHDLFVLWRFLENILNFLSHVFLSINT